jgi:hypothetical protein
VFCALVLTALGCKGTPEQKLVQRAQFGIFYGGQVQERTELPFELDRTKQSQGIRIEFAKPLARDVPVSWELGMPILRKSRMNKDAAAPDRVTQVGETLARAGQERLDIALPFKPGDPLGVWHIYVKVADAVVLDRDFTVYDRAQRARERSDAGTLIP